MTRNPPRTIWVVLCRDVDGEVFTWDRYDVRVEARYDAVRMTRDDRYMAKLHNRPRRHYWVEAYDRRGG